MSRFQPAAGLALDAFSFVVSAVTLLLIRSKRPSAKILRTPSPSDTSKTKAGNASDEFAPPHTFLQFLRTSHFLQVILVLMVLGNFIGGGVGTVAIPIFVHTFLKAGTTGYGLIISAFGLGALVGCISTGSLGRLPRRGVLVQLIWFIQAVAITLIPFAGIAFGVAGAALASAIEGLTNSLGNITFRTIIQQHLPRHLLGRISGVFAFCQFSLYPLSVAIAGLMVVHWGPLSVFLADGVVGFFALVYGLSQGEIREI